jgi:hypothetical protein
MSTSALDANLFQRSTGRHTLARLTADRAIAALAGVVALSFVARLVAAFTRATATYFPDEYIYSSLAQNLASAGRPLVRDVPASFPALLEPLLAAPFWLQSDPEIAFRLTQALHAATMSLAAVPVFLLCRRLQLATGPALAAATAAVLVPDLRYASFVVADPIAYPLALSAVTAGVAVLTRPTRANQLAFVAFAGLATFARLQYLVLPAALVLGALLLERGRAGRVVRDLRLTLGLCVLPAAAGLALGADRVLGYYGGIVDLDLGPGALARWVATSGFLLTYAAGCLLVPGALVGLALALHAPRTRAERAFGALAVPFAGLLVAQAALYSANGSERFNERYLMTLLALVVPAYLLFARRREGTLAVGALAAGVATAAAALPVTAYATAHGDDASAFLAAVRHLGERIGSVDAALAVALAAAVLSALALALARLRPRGTGVALVVALTTGALASFGASAADRANSDAVRSAFLPERLTWVDDASTGRVALLQLPFADAGRALDQLFWNRSVREVLTIGDAEAVDAYGSQSVRVSPAGQLLVGGRPVVGPLLVQTSGSTFAPDGADRLDGGPGFELWRWTEGSRLGLLAAGRYDDGWLAARASFMVWPARKPHPRVLRLTLELPPGFGAQELRVSAGPTRRRLALRPGTRATIVLPVPAARPRTVLIETSAPAFLPDARVVSARATAVRLLPAGGAASVAGSRGSA